MKNIPQIPLTTSLNLITALIWIGLATHNFSAGNKISGGVNLLTSLLNITAAILYFKSHNENIALTLKAEKEKNTAIVVNMAKPKEKVFDFFR